MSKRVLMCRPDFYDIEYEINAWMHQDNQVDRELAMRQWVQIHEIYQAIGVAVELIPGFPGLPDLVFTANGALVIDGKVMLPRFKNPERQGETPKFELWFRNNGYTDIKMPEHDFEGEGDCLFANNTLFAGHGFRSDVASHPELKSFFGHEVVSLKLVDPRFYHLDTCFCPLNEETVMFYPAAFDDASQAEIRKRFKLAIELNAEDAAAFGANAFSDGHNVVLSEAVKDLPSQLKTAGFNTILTPISEFQKSGGGVKCLTLELRS